MSTLRVLVVDDEPPARQRLEDLIARAPETELVASCGSASDALASILRLRPDVVFSDIRMPRLSGFELIGALPIEERPVIVLVSAYPEHAPEAFDHDVADYLLKPFDDERFTRALDRAREQLRLRRMNDLATELFHTLGRGEPRVRAEPQVDERYLERVVIAASDGRRIVLPVNDVDCIIARGAYALIHAGDERHLLRERMTALEQRLDPRRFQRIHRSAIVRLDAVIALEPHWKGDYAVRLRNGMRVRLSRGRKIALETALGWKGS